MGNFNFMNIVFRVDSSTAIGSGHLMRCLTFAAALHEHGSKITFISRELPGNGIALIKGKGYKIICLSYDTTVLSKINSLSLYHQWLGTLMTIEITEVQKCLNDLGNIDLLVVDSYALDGVWERAMRPYAKRLMVIDDLANRKHDCDILLDQNFYLDLEKRYIGLVPSHCNLLLGPSYALLRNEFIEARKSLKIRDGKVARILVFFGGVDITNETQKVLVALIKLNFPGIVDVIVGLANPNRDTIKNFCAEHKNYNFYCQVVNIAKLMAKADLAIGAGGSTTWERCCLGLPSLVISIAENQGQLAENGDAYGAIIYLGIKENINVASLAQKIAAILANTATLKDVALKAYKLVDGLGTERVIKALWNRH